MAAMLPTTAKMTQVETKPWKLELMSLSLASAILVRCCCCCCRRCCCGEEAARSGRSGGSDG